MFKKVFFRIIRFLVFSESCYVIKTQFRMKSLNLMQLFSKGKFSQFYKIRGRTRVMPPYSPKKQITSTC